MDMEVPKSMMKGDYTFRMVFGLMQLKEKIVILEHGLNDVAIERQKYMISHVIMPEIAQNGYELYFAKVDEPSEGFEHGAIYYFYEDKETEELMTVRFAMDNYYEHCLACEIDPRMKVEGGHIHKFIIEIVFFEETEEQYELILHVMVKSVQRNACHMLTMRAVIHE